LFGVDFDDAHPEGSAADGGNGGGSLGDGNGNGNPGQPDGGSQSVQPDGGSDDAPIPPVDGGCGNRVLCGGGCVLRNDPKYGCGTCTPCAAPPEGQSNSCSGTTCAACPWGTKPQGGQCIAKAWVPQETGISDGGDFSAIWGTGKNDIYIMGMSGIFHSDGSGTWKLQSTPAPKPTYQGPTTLWGPDAQNVLAMGGGAVWRHGTEGWQSWSALGTCAQSQRLWASSMNDVYAVDGTSICHSKNGGAFFTTTRVNESLDAIWGSGPNDVYIAGTFHPTTDSSFVIYHSTGLDSWTLFQTIGSGTFTGSWGIGGSVYVFGITDILAMTSLTGGKFIKQTNPVRATINAMWGNSATNVYAVGYGGLVLRSTDKSTWEQAPGVGDAIELLGIWGSGPDDIYIVGTGGFVAHLE